MRTKDILEILVPIILVLGLWRVTPIFWQFFKTWFNGIRYRYSATPVRQLSEGERAALAFLGGPAYTFRALVGVTDLPWKKLAHVTGKRANVYCLQGPLQTWGYAMHRFGEVHRCIQGVEVHMPLENIDEKTDPHNVVEVLFSKGVGIILTCNGRPTLIDTQRHWQTLLQPDTQPASQQEPHA